ncbi:PilZ domain-containing protein [Parahaliea mediterranea]|uniref:PilZ domain-containing protein n=1 Tax=Parahaliea mediterranea TaxID=651086 RepID=A0A939DHH0_9GAMM|nr:PilZ domain-containing protein [Parahaliea mediterranea]MBN7798261.1 PilZ domain-containing protein [Parahaliea mediterranea]
MAEDKRNYRRLPLQSTVFLEVESRAETGEGQSTILRCRSADISERGLSLGLERAVAVGAVLQVGIDLADEGFNTIFLAAEVVWCKPGDDGWRAGFTILHASDSDFVRWRALLRQLVGEDEAG